MRPIKFRAWVPSTKEILYKISGIDFRDEDEGADRNRVFTKDRFIPKDDVVLMQFTGLQDKNGKEIWEGDILKGASFNYRVAYHAGGFCAVKILPVLNDIQGAEDEDKILWYLPYSIDNLGYEKEVLGNIYENPELLVKP